MSLKIRCPNQHVLQVTEAHIGKKVRCSKCQAVLVVEASSTNVVAGPSPAAAPVQKGVSTTEGSSLASSPSRLPGSPTEAEPHLAQTDMGRWARLTRMGMGFHYAKVICFFLGVLCIIAVAPLVTIAGTTEDEALRERRMMKAGQDQTYLKLQARGRMLFNVTGTLIIACTALVSLAMLIGAVGSLQYIRATQAAKGLPLGLFSGDAIGLLALSIPSTIYYAVFLLLPDERRSLSTSWIGVLTAIGSFVGIVLLCAVWVMFMFFLRTLNRHFDDVDGSRAAVRRLLLNIALTIATPVYLAIAVGVPVFVASKEQVIVAWIIVTVMSLLWLVVCAHQLSKTLALIVFVRDHLKQLT